MAQMVTMTSDDSTVRTKHIRFIRQPLVRRTHQRIQINSRPTTRASRVTPIVIRGLINAHTQVLTHMRRRPTRYLTRDLTRNHQRLQHIIPINFNRQRMDSTSLLRRLRHFRMNLIQIFFSRTRMRTNFIDTNRRQYGPRTSTVFTRRHHGNFNSFTRGTRTVTRQTTMFINTLIAILKSGLVRRMAVNTVRLSAIGANHRDVTYTLDMGLRRFLSLHNTRHLQRKQFNRYTNTQTNFSGRTSHHHQSYQQPSQHHTAQLRQNIQCPTSVPRLHGCQFTLNIRHLNRRFPTFSLFLAISTQNPNMTLATQFSLGTFNSRRANTTTLTMVLNRRNIKSITQLTTTQTHRQ